MECVCVFAARVKNNLDSIYTVIPVVARFKSSSVDLPEGEEPELLELGPARALKEGEHCSSGAQGSRITEKREARREL